MRFEIASPRPSPWRLVVTKSSKTACSRSGAMPEPVSVTSISTWSPLRAVVTTTRPPGCGRLDRVGHQVAVDAAEREPIAFDDQRLRRVARFDGDAHPRAFGPHRLDDLRERAVDVQQETLHRSRLDDVAQVVHEPLEVLELALDRGANRQARFRVEVVADQQARAVAQVLDRVREIVDQAGGDAADHRLPLLPLDVSPAARPADWPSC